MKSLTDNKVAQLQTDKCTNIPLEAPPLFEGAASNILVNAIY